VTWKWSDVEQKERLEVLRDKYVQLDNTRNASASKKLKVNSTDCHCDKSTQRLHC